MSGGERRRVHQPKFLLYGHKVAKNSTYVDLSTCTQEHILFSWLQSMSFGLSFCLKNITCALVACWNARYAQLELVHHCFFFKSIIHEHKSLTWDNDSCWSTKPLVRSSLFLEVGWLCVRSEAVCHLPDFSALGMRLPANLESSTCFVFSSAIYVV